MGEQEDVDDLTGLGVSASLARLYAADQRGFVEQLALTLESALPGEEEVERKGGLFSEKRIGGLRVPLGDYHYVLRIPQTGPISAERTKVIRGIKLKTEPIQMEEWLTAVADEMSAYAETNLNTRDALKALLGE